MTRVREISYYAPMAGGYDQTAQAELAARMKAVWSGQVVFGTVFSGEHAGEGYMQIDFDSWEAFANLQDNWATNQEWVAFLQSIASKVTPLTAREIVTLD